MNDQKMMADAILMISSVFLLPSFLAILGMLYLSIKLHGSAILLAGIGLCLLWIIFISLSFKPTFESWKYLWVLPGIILLLGLITGALINYAANLWLENNISKPSRRKIVCTSIGVVAWILLTFTNAITFIIYAAMMGG